MKVFITREIPETAVNLLSKKKYDIKVYRGNKPIPYHLLKKEVNDADAVISLLTDKFDEEMIDAMPRCRIIANYAVGFNNINVSYAKKKGIIVTNTPDVLTDSTADLTMTLALACSRRLNEGVDMMKKRKFKGWQPKLLLGIELKGKNFGIIGAGRIGTAVGKRAIGFGVNILYYDSRINTELEAMGAKKVQLNFLLKKSDIISVHLPLTGSTHQFLNKERLRLIKEGAIFINTARGEVVDEKELIKMLKEGKLFSAGFDVYNNEPDINPELYELNNAILLPHLGSGTVDARNAMAKLAAENVISVLSGKTKITPV